MSGRVDPDAGLDATIRLNGPPRPLYPPPSSARRNGARPRRRICGSAHPAVRMARLAGILVLVLQLLSGIASANGSTSISTAPLLPIGQTFASGWSEQHSVDNLGNGEFWLLRINAGDKLTLDATVSQGCNSVSFDFYTPDTTDTTVGGANTAASPSIYSRGEITFTAPYTGSWILWVSSCSTESYTLSTTLTAFSGTTTVNGSSGIPTAPELALSQSVATGWAEQHGLDNLGNGQFWSVSMNGGDSLTIDATVKQGCNSLGFNFYAPGTSDNTVASTNTAASPSVYSQGQISFVAPYTGTWVLWIGAGCSAESFVYNATVARYSGVSATGAASISAAPALAIGRPTASGWSEQNGLDNLGNGEFWRAALGAGDQLTVDATVTSGCNGLGFHFYPQSATDFTVQSLQTTADPSVERQGSVTFTAPSGGNWILWVTAGCGTEAYDFTASVAHAKKHTTLHLTGPARVRHRRSFTLRGTITPATAGVIALQVSNRGHWRTVTTVAIGTDGSFRWRTSIRTRGRYRFRAHFGGDATHTASSSSVSVTVV